jgi:FKBP-type peptidyl-prolyl cis-trans isomerase FklB
MKLSKTLTFIFTFLCLESISISAQQPAQKQVTQPAQTQESVKLTTSADSSQYILGAYLGQYLKANGLTITNASLFIKGMDDVLSNKPLMVEADSIPKRMNEYLVKMNRERNQLLETQLFEKVRGQPGVGILPNGVCYIISRPATGQRPQLADSVEIHIKGYLPTGTVFEDTYTRNTPLKTTPANLIPGMKEALQIIPAGSVWRIFIPSSLAYGEKGVQGVIPPYSAIVFDVELLSVYK